MPLNNNTGDTDITSIPPGEIQAWFHEQGVELDELEIQELRAELPNIHAKHKKRYNGQDKCPCIDCRAMRGILLNRATRGQRPQPTIRERLRWRNSME